jgi:hypothetical protein
MAFLSPFMLRRRRSTIRSIRLRSRLERLASEYRFLMLYSACDPLLLHCRRRRRC